jgi:hypothetical protein
MNSDNRKKYVKDSSLFSKSFHVWFVADKVAMRLGFLWVLIFPLYIVIQPVLLILFSDHMPNNLSNW